jgi:hypothetical protein
MGLRKREAQPQQALPYNLYYLEKMDQSKFASMASLDLSAPFDLVDLDLLNERIRVMGLPYDVRKLLEIWLENRFYYSQTRL